jgi:asparagine N-glycosylation enzyme membrane subunit Stt3
LKPISITVVISTNTVNAYETSRAPKPTIIGVNLTEYLKYPPSPSDKNPKTLLSILSAIIFPFSSISSRYSKFFISVPPISGIVFGVIKESRLADLNVSGVKVFLILEELFKIENP